MPGPPDNSMDKYRFACAHLLCEMWQQVAAPAKLFAEARDECDKQERTHPDDLSTRHTGWQMHCSPCQINAGRHDPEEDSEADHHHVMPGFPPTPTSTCEAIPK